MKQIVIISGKGGTGKTVVTASFAALSSKAVLADLDVDASNLHLLLRPEIKERHPFVAGEKALIDTDRCTACGRCLEVCRFDALAPDGTGKPCLDPLACEGCGLCFRVCDPGAVRMNPVACGEWFVSRTRFGPFVHARLAIARENSGKLVTEVRKRAREAAEREEHEILLMDGPPGIGCPVIAALSGADLALVITEPTPSGIQDMERVIGVARHFKIRTACAINKHDLNLDNSAAVEAWCAGRSIPVLGKIPFDEAVVESVVEGVPFVEYSRNPAAESIRRMWDSVLRGLS